MPTNRELVAAAKAHLLKTTKSGKTWDGQGQPHSGEWWEAWKQLDLILDCLAPPTDKLPWAPPVLANPSTVTINAPGRYVLPGGDVIIKQTVPVSVQGDTTCVELAGSCRNLVWIAGDLRATPQAQADKANTLVVRGSFTGTLHFEGIQLHAGADVNLGLQVPNTAVVQWQNIFGRAATFQDYKEPVHADSIQNWAGPAEFRAYNVTQYTNRQGQLWMAVDKANYPRKVVQERVDIHASPPQPNSQQPTLPLIGGAMVWHVFRQTVFEAKDVYLECGWYDAGYHRSLDDSIGGWDNGDGTYTDPPASYFNPDGTPWDGVKRQGYYVRYPTVPNLAKAQYTWGVPPTGSYCAEVADGLAYVSPGYV